MSNYETNPVGALQVTYDDDVDDDNDDDDNGKGADHRNEVLKMLANE